MYRPLSLAAAFMLTAVPQGAVAATQIIDAQGILTGATGVMVNGRSYDVSFVQGSCASVYGSCTSSAFDFADYASASLAAQALGDQVFVGEFDTDPTSVLGCGAVNYCLALVASELAELDWDWGGAFFANAATPTGDNVNSFTAGFAFNSAETEGYQFARFTLSAVPEPASWAMTVGGFGLIGSAMRRRQRTTVRYA